MSTPVSALSAAASSISGNVPLRLPSTSIATAHTPPSASTGTCRRYQRIAASCTQALIAAPSTKQSASTSHRSGSTGSRKLAADSRATPEQSAASARITSTFPLPRS